MAQGFIWSRPLSLTFQSEPLMCFLAAWLGFTCTFNTLTHSPIYACTCSICLDPHSGLSKPLRDISLTTLVFLLCKPNFNNVSCQWSPGVWGYCGPVVNQQCAALCPARRVSPPGLWVTAAVVWDSFISASLKPKSLFFLSSLRAALSFPSALRVHILPAQFFKVSEALPHLGLPPGWE